MVYTADSSLFIAPPYVYKELYPPCRNPQLDLLGFRTGGLILVVASGYILRIPRRRRPDC